MNENLQRMRNKLDKINKKDEIVMTRSNTDEYLSLISKGLTGLKSGTFNIMEFPEGRELFPKGIEQFDRVLWSLKTKLDGRF